MIAPRVTGLLASTIFMSGAAFAAMTPYRAIIGVETLGLSNLAFGIIMALNALGGLLIAVGLGWLSDRVQDRRVLVLVCAVGGAFGFCLTWIVQTPIGFAVAFCFLVPFGNALFSQSFSFSRAFFDREQPDRSELIMSFLRTGFTLAWIAVPPLAGWLATKTSAYSVFGISAIAHVGCTIAVALLWTDPVSRVGLPKGTSRTAITNQRLASLLSPARRMGVLGVTLSMVTLQLNMSVLPLVILSDLGGTLGQVGIVSGVAAAIEVPVMIGWGYLALRWRKERILYISCAIFAIYFVFVSQSTSFFFVLLSQFFAAIAIGALLSININYLQESIPGQVGLSTSLVDVTNVIAALGAAAIFAANPWTSYAPLLLVAAGICAIGAAVFFIAMRMENRPTAPLG